MKETLLSFRLDIGEVLDADLRGDGEIVSIQGFGRRHVLIGPEGPTELPSAWPASGSPHLRYLREGLLLLVDTCSDNVTGENSFLLTESGRFIHRFHLGPGVIDVVSLTNAFAVAYHPDAAREYGLETGALAGTGIAVFDSTGRMIAALNHDLEREGWHATNIQCLAARDSGELVFVPEFLKGPAHDLDSPIVFYDWRTRAIRVVESRYPRPLAISSRETSLLLYSPESSEDELLELDLQGNLLCKRGFHSQIFRGLPNGRFLAQVGAAQYRLFEFEPAPAPRLEQPIGLFAERP